MSLHIVIFFSYSTKLYLNFKNIQNHLHCGSAHVYSAVTSDMFVRRRSGTPFTL